MLAIARESSRAKAAPCEFPLSASVASSRLLLLSSARVPFVRKARREIAKGIAREKEESRRNVCFEQFAHEKQKYKYRVERRNLKERTEIER